MDEVGQHGDPLSSERRRQLPQSGSAIISGWHLSAVRRPKRSMDEVVQGGDHREDRRGVLGVEGVARRRGRWECHRRRVLWRSAENVRGCARHGRFAVQVRRGREQEHHHDDEDTGEETGDDEAEFSKEDAATATFRGTQQQLESIPDGTDYEDADSVI